MDEWTGRQTGRETVRQIGYEHAIREKATVNGYIYSGYIRVD